MDSSENPPEPEEKSLLDSVTSIFKSESSKDEALKEPIKEESGFFASVTNLFSKDEKKEVLEDTSKFVDSSNNSSNSSESKGLESTSIVILLKSMSSIFDLDTNIVSFHENLELLRSFTLDIESKYEKMEIAAKTKDTNSIANSITESSVIEEYDHRSMASIRDDLDSVMDRLNSVFPASVADEIASNYNVNTNGDLLNGQATPVARDKRSKGKDFYDYSAEKPLSSFPRSHPTSENSQKDRFSRTAPLHSPVEGLYPPSGRKTVKSAETRQVNADFFDRNSESRTVRESRSLLSRNAETRKSGDFEDDDTRMRSSRISRNNVQHQTLDIDYSDYRV